MTSHLILEARIQLMNAFNASYENMTRVDFNDTGVGYSLYYRCMDSREWIYVK
jgi:hypothetical protein